MTATFIATIYRESSTHKVRADGLATVCGLPLYVDDDERYDSLPGDVDCPRCLAHPKEIT